MAEFTYDFEVSDNPDWTVATEATQITRGQARVILADRLLRVILNSSTGRFEDADLVASRIIDMLPEEALTNEIIASMDLRDVVSPIVEAADDDTINGVKIPAALRAMATQMMPNLEAVQRDELTRQLSASMPADQAAIAADEMMNESTENPGVLSPLIPRSAAEPNPDTIEASVNDALGPLTGDSTVSLDDPSLSGTGGGTGFNASDFLAAAVNGSTSLPVRPAIMSDEDLRFMFQTESADAAFSGLQREMFTRNSWNATRAEYMAGADGPIEGLGRRINVIDPSRVQVDPSEQLYSNQGETIDKTYTLTEAMQLPYTWSAKEVQAVSKKMEKAGLFDSSQPMSNNNPADPQFKKAWQTLLSMSYSRKTPAYTVLSEMSTQRDLAQQEADRQLGLMPNYSAELTDPARLRVYANAFAREAIGRPLGDAEVNAMVTIIHEMQVEDADRRAQFEVDKMRRAAAAERGELTDAELAETQSVQFEGIDYQARIEEMMHAEYGNEIEAKEEGGNLEDQYATFQQLLAGPGRGGSF